MRYDDNLLEDYSTYEFMYDEYSEFLNSVKTGLFFNDWINETKLNNYIKNDPFNINKLELEVEKKRNNTEESPFSDTSFGQWYNEIKKKYEA